MKDAHTHLWDAQCRRLGFGRGAIPELIWVCVCGDCFRETHLGASPSARHPAYNFQCYRMVQTQRPSERPGAERLFRSPNRMIDVLVLVAVGVFASSLFAAGSDRGVHTP